MRTDGNGRIFYENTETGQATYDVPTNDQLSTYDVPDWSTYEMRVDQSGHPFYFNVNTEQSTYDAPSCKDPPMVPPPQPATLPLEMAEESLPEGAETQSKVLQQDRLNIPPDVGIQLIVLVPSARHHVQQRMRVRATWAAQNDSRVRTVFSVGKFGCDIPDPFNELSHGTYNDIGKSVLAAALGCMWRKNISNLSTEAAAAARLARQEEIAVEHKALAQEAALHGDMLLLPVVDVYRHLCHKSKLAYRWLFENTKVEYVLKTDDDSLVATGRVLRALAKIQPLSNPTIIGNIICGGQVKKQMHRNQERIYLAADYYPPFPASNGIILNRKMLGLIAERSQQGKLRNYNCDECALGIWAQDYNRELGLPIRGDAVEVLVQGDWNNQDGRQSEQHKGKVISVNTVELGGDLTQTYNIQFDDGANDPAVPGAAIHLTGCSPSSSSRESCALPVHLINDDRLGIDAPYRLDDRSDGFMGGSGSVVAGVHDDLVWFMRTTEEEKYKTELFFDITDPEHLLPLWDAYLLANPAPLEIGGTALHGFAMLPSWPSIQVQFCHRMWLYFSNVANKMEHGSTIAICRHCQDKGKAKVTHDTGASPERAGEAITRALAVDLGLAGSTASDNDEDDQDNDESSNMPLTPQQEALVNDGTLTRFSHMWQVVLRTSLESESELQQLADKLFDKAEEIDPNREHF
jgi:hypothetical protein